MIIPPNLHLIIAALSLMAGGVAGWTIRDWKADADQFRAQTRADKREDEARAQGLDQGKAYAGLVAQLGTDRATDRTTIERIYQNAPPVPADCAAPAAVVRVLENGVGRANAAASGQPLPALPTPPDAAGAADRPAAQPVGS